MRLFHAAGDSLIFAQESLSFLLDRENRPNAESLEAWLEDYSLGEIWNRWVERLEGLANVKPVDATRLGLAGKVSIRPFDAITFSLADLRP